VIRRARAAAVVGAAVFLALHLLYLPRSLEDLDSINFALALHHFDVAAHQPHPPGYPAFIAVAKLARLAVPSDARALALVGIAAGALGIVALVALYRRLDEAATERWPTIAAAMAATAPLYWFTASRPLSDMAGLAAAICVQAMLLSATTETGLAVAAFLGGAAVGIRSQVFWLTVPLAVFVCRVRRVSAGSRRHPPYLHTLVAYAAGLLVWAVPLVFITGGPAAYWRAISNQGAEDLSGVRMLWTTPTARELGASLYYALAAPWATVPIAIFVGACALVGAWRLARDNRQALRALAAAFLPYFFFDLLFQETVTTRYALPLVVPVAFLAARGLAAAGPVAGPILAAVVIAFDAHVGGSSLAAYAGAKAPAFRMLDDMESEVVRGEQAPLLAMDRREQLDLRRPLRWTNGVVAHLEPLASPPQHEWLEAVNYWTGEHQWRPVWFVADPLRADIDLIQHGEPESYRWNIPYPVLIGGARPGEMDWYRLSKPEWFVGNGWALTPESAGVATIDRQGLEHGAIRAWVRPGGVGILGPTMVIGGRNLSSPPVTVRITLSRPDGRGLDRFDVAPGFFVRLAPLDADALRSPGDAYSEMSLAATPPANVRIEQFDVSAERPIFGYADGWQEPEYNPETGMRWRWLSERGELRVHAPHGGVLRLEGESPLKYFSRPSHLIVRAGGRVIADEMLSSDFEIGVPLPPDFPSEAGVVTFETDQFYVPAERSRRTADRRRLGLRIFSCEIRNRPASAPGR